MAEADNRKEVEKEAAIIRLRLFLLREEEQKIKDQIEWEINAFSLRNPGFVIE